MDETQVKERTGEAAQNLSEKGQEMADKAKGTAKAVSETAKEWGQKAQGTARDAGAAADLYLHEYAWTTVVLVAVTAGLLGYFLGRQSS